MVRNTRNRRGFSSGWSVNPVRVNSGAKERLSSVISTVVCWDRNYGEIRFQCRMCITFLLIFFLIRRKLLLLSCDTRTQTSREYSSPKCVSAYDLNSETQHSHGYLVITGGMLTVEKVCLYEFMEVWCTNLGTHICFILPIKFVSIFILGFKNEFKITFSIYRNFLKLNFIYSPSGIDILK